MMVTLASIKFQPDPKPVTIGPRTRAELLRRVRRPESERNSLRSRSCSEAREVRMANCRLTESAVFVALMISGFSGFIMGMGTTAVLFRKLLNCGGN